MNLDVLEEEVKEKEIKIVGMNKLEKVPPTFYNVLFYKNKICSTPKGAFIKEIHKTWLVKNLKSKNYFCLGFKITINLKTIMVMSNGFSHIVVSLVLTQNLIHKKEGS